MVTTETKINQSLKGSCLNSYPSSTIKEIKMRLITKKITEAFRDYRAQKVNNSEVKVDHFDGRPGSVALYLHGNLIATFNPTGMSGYHHVGQAVSFTLAGWNTPTTKERLNGLFKTMGLTARIRQRNYQLYLDTPTESVKINAYGWFDIGGKMSIVSDYLKHK